MAATDTSAETWVLASTQPEDEGLLSQREGSGWREIPEGRDKMKVLKERLRRSEVKSSLFPLSLYLVHVLLALRRQQSWGYQALTSSHMFMKGTCLHTADFRLLSFHLFSLPSGVVRRSVPSDIINLTVMLALHCLLFLWLSSTFHI